VLAGFRDAFSLDLSERLHAEVLDLEESAALFARSPIAAMSSASGSCGPHERTRCLDRDVEVLVDLSFSSEIIWIFCFPAGCPRRGRVLHQGTGTGEARRLVRQDGVRPEFEDETVVVDLLATRVSSTA
jgi:hypothetical protein